MYPAKILTLCDAPAVLQPNGRVLVLAGTLYRNAGPPVDFFSQKMQLFEYDPVAGSLTKLPTAEQPPSGARQDTWTGRFLLLPTGEILLSTEQSQVYIYTPDPSEGSYQAVWQPTITTFPTTLIIGHSYLLTGTGINGISRPITMATMRRWRYQNDVAVALEFCDGGHRETAPLTGQYVQEQFPVGEITRGLALTKTHAL